GGGPRLPAGVKHARRGTPRHGGTNHAYRRYGQSLPRRRLLSAAGMARVPAREAPRAVEGGVGTTRLLAFDFRGVVARAWTNSPQAFPLGENAAQPGAPPPLTRDSATLTGAARGGYLHSAPSPVPAISFPYTGQCWNEILQGSA